MIRIFYAFQATSVARDADPVAVGLLAVLPTGEHCTFYAEFTNFEKQKCDEWVIKNVIGNLKYPHVKTNCVERIDFVGEYKYLEVVGEFGMIANRLKEWLAQFGEVEFWAYFDMIDAPMLVDLIAEFDNFWYNRLHDEGMKYVKKGLPKHLPNVLYYAFYDLQTALKVKGKHPDVSRALLVGAEANSLSQHNALDAAKMAYLVYQKIMS